MKDKSSRENLPQFSALLGANNTNGQSLSNIKMRSNLVGHLSVVSKRRSKALGNSERKIAMGSNSITLSEGNKEGGFISSN